MFTTRIKICQSCGMPLARDPEGGGTNADGTKTTEFCSHCYVDGQFTQPDITAEEMVVFVEAKLKTLGFPGFVAHRFTREIPKLGRWVEA